MSSVNWGRRDLDFEDARTQLGDLAGTLDRRVFLGELIGRADDLGADDLGEGVGHLRDRRQIRSFENQPTGLLLLGRQGLDKQAGEQDA